MEADQDASSACKDAFMSRSITMHVTIMKNFLKNSMQNHHMLSVCMARVNAYDCLYAGSDLVKYGSNQIFDSHVHSIQSVLRSFLPGLLFVDGTGFAIGLAMLFIVGAIT